MPFGTFLRLHSARSGHFRIHLYDSVGQTIRTSRESTRFLEFRGSKRLAPGVQAQLRPLCRLPRMPSGGPLISAVARRATISLVGTFLTGLTLRITRLRVDVQRHDSRFYFRRGGWLVGNLDRMPTLQESESTARHVFSATAWRAFACAVRKQVRPCLAGDTAAQSKAATTRKRLANQPLWMQDHRDQGEWGFRPALSVLFRRNTSSTSIA